MPVAKSKSVSEIIDPRVALNDQPEMIAHNKLVSPIIAELVEVKERRSQRRMNPQQTVESPVNLGDWATGELSATTLSSHDADQADKKREFDLTKRLEIGNSVGEVIRSKIIKECMNRLLPGHVESWENFIASLKTVSVSMKKLVAPINEVGDGITITAPIVEPWGFFGDASDEVTYLDVHIREYEEHLENLKAVVAEQSAKADRQAA